MLHIHKISKHDCADDRAMRAYSVYRFLGAVTDVHIREQT